MGVITSRDTVAELREHIRHLELIQLAQERLLARQRECLEMWMDFHRKAPSSQHLSIKKQRMRAAVQTTKTLS